MISINKLYTSSAIALYLSAIAFYFVLLLGLILIVTLCSYLPKGISSFIIPLWIIV